MRALLKKQAADAKCHEEFPRAPPLFDIYNITQVMDFDFPLHLKIHMPKVNKMGTVMTILFQYPARVLVESANSDVFKDTVSKSDGARNIV